MGKRIWETLRAIVKVDKIYRNNGSFLYWNTKIKIVDNKNRKNFLKKGDFDGFCIKEVAD